MVALSEVRAHPVLVIGEALIDVVRTDDGGCEEHVGGSPANVALGLGRLGFPVRFRTAVGRDSRGERIAAHLADSGVVVEEESFVLDHTSTAIAHISSGGNARYDFEVEWSVGAPIALHDARVIHVGSLGCYIEPGAATVHQMVNRSFQHAAVTFDPNIRPDLVGDRRAAQQITEEISSLCDLVKLSDEDAAWLYPGLSANDVLSKFLGLGARVVAVTLGRQGAVIASQEARLEVEPRPVLEVDTVGAGDAFMAAMVASLAAGELGTDYTSLRVAGETATAAASITVGRRGADLPTRAELGRSHP